MPEDSPSTTNAGFGLRMEKMLRAAEREAAEIRANAEQDAAGIVSRARLEAEVEDRERRQGWMERERTVADAVRAGAEQVGAAQRQAAEIMETVELEAQRIRGHAHNRAKEISAAAEEAAAATVRRAQLEVERLERVQAAARGDLDRVMRTLGGMRDALAYELESQPPQREAGQREAGPREPVQRDGGPPAPGQQVPPAQTPPSQAPVPQPRGGALGGRPGDFRRARTAGIVPDPEPTATQPVRRPAHESVTRG